MFGMSAEQEKELRSIVPNVDSLLAAGDIREILLILDDAIVDTFDNNQEPTAKTDSVQSLYDMVYNSK